MYCPDCGAEMRQTQRGAALKRGERWVCPVARSEVTRDERGNLKRAAGAKHAYTRAWTADELEATI